MVDFLFPDVGEGIHEGKLVHWRVKEGDTVMQDQILVEVETDKAVVEIPSPHAAMIQKLYGKEGEVIKVGSVLVTFGDGNSTAQAQVAPIAQNQDEFKRDIDRGTRKVESNLVPSPPLPHEHEPPARPIVPIEGPTASATSRPIAAPSTRRLARELGIDLTSMRGSGPAGRITDADVQAAAGKPVAATSQVQASPAEITNSELPASATVAPAHIEANAVVDVLERIPYSGRRKAIGDHMVASHAVPAVTEFAQADVTNLVALRERMKSDAQTKGVKLTFLAFFAKATCAALRRHKLLDSRLTATEIEEFAQVHLGIAVDTPKGLVVPVVHDAHTKSIMELASEIQTLAQAARDDKLSLERLRGSTFSISSVGNLRVQGFTPLINTPEVAILGIGAIQDLPWVVEGRIEARKVVTLSLTFDHRVIDGVEAAQFLTDLVQLLEDPSRFLLEA